MISLPSPYKMLFMGSYHCVIVLLASARFFTNGIHIQSSTFTNTTNNVGTYKGDVIFGGLFPLHLKKETNAGVDCGDLYHDRGIHRLEAMYYAIHAVNKNVNILPNVTVGAKIRDTCGYDTHALEQSVQFVTVQKRGDNSCNGNSLLSTDGAFLPGVIGAADSSVSLQVANLFRLFRLPQVSYASTSSDLNDRERFKYFFRTVPPDLYQAKAFVDIVKYFGWTSVFGINSKGNYGEKGMEEFKKLARKAGICVVSTETVTGNDNFSTILKSFDNELFSSTKVVVLFASTPHLQLLFNASKSMNPRKEFIWLGSDLWGTRIKFIQDDKLENIARNAVTLTLQTKQIADFREYFIKLRPTKNQDLRNPWFRQFWEEHFKCSLSDSICQSNNTISPNYHFDDKVPYVIDAVYSLAYTLDKLYSRYCPDRKGACEKFLSVSGEDVLQVLRNITFPGVFGNTKFDENGSTVRNYEVRQFTGRNYTLVGIWNSSLTMFNEKVSELNNAKSYCSMPCKPGQIRIPKAKGPTCCYSCQSCGPYQYVTPQDRCKTCPSGYQPNGTLNGCQSFPIRHLEKMWVISLAVLAGIGIILTSFTFMVFIYYNSTPVVKASARELSYPLLIGVLLCYSLAFMLVSEPSKTVCGVIRFGLGFCFCCCYSALLTKTSRIARIFSGHKPRFISPQSQLVIMGIIILIEALLAVIGLFISKPNVGPKQYVTPTNTGILHLCRIPRYDVAVAYSYNLLLIILCTIFTFRTRKVPASFNEARYLGFVMYTTCIIWTAFIPVYYFITIGYRVVAICMNIILSATSILAGIFGPKVYIIIFRPARNVRSRSMRSDTQFHSNGSYENDMASCPRKMTTLSTLSLPCDSVSTVSRYQENNGIRRSHNNKDSENNRNENSTIIGNNNSGKKKNGPYCISDSAL